MTRWLALLIVAPLALGILLAGYLLGRGAHPEPVPHGSDIHEMQVATHDFGEFVKVKKAELDVFFAEQARKVQAASAARARATRVVARSGPTPGAQRRGFPCGGDLPPCYVLERESLMAADPARVWNGNCYMPVGSLGQCGRSTASGLWQFLRSTWAGFGGYVNAADAPVAVQNEKARQLWAGGRGCSHWSACG